MHHCWSLYIMTDFSWSLYIQTDFLQSLYILTEICAVCIYNDWFHIQTITYITKTNLRITCEIIIYVNWWGNKRCQRYWLYFESKYCGSHYRKWIWQFYNKTLSTLLQISKQSLWSFRQSHYREVLQWEIFMEQELRLGLDLGRFFNVFMGQNLFF